MDSQLIFILDNNTLTPIYQSNICYILPSNGLVQISNDNIINSTEVSLLSSEELICDYDQQIFPLDERELGTSDFSLPIEDSGNQFFVECNEIVTTESTIGESINEECVSASDQNFYNCEHCEAKFVHLKLLNRHKRTHVYEKPYKCEHCHESFNFAVNLKVHSIVHQNTLNNVGITKNVCCICNRIFRRSTSLRGHINGHAVSEYFNCDLCDEIFLAKLFYDSHLENYHKKDKTSKIVKVSSDGDVNINRDCKLCGKSFKKPSMLVRHMRVHNGEKPFKCNMCDRQFSQKNSLTTHLLRHTGEKPFSCTLCYMRFTQKGNLKMHKQKVHNKYSSNSDDMKYPCNKCSCVFRKIGSLNRHITEVHSGEVRKSKLINQAVISNDVINFNEIFSQINYLKQNQDPDDGARETEDDNIIQLADRVENGILIHRKVQQLHIDRGKKMLSCLNCGKLFRRPSDLLRHIRVHTKEKPFECYLCKDRFSVKRSLSVHYKTHESTLRKFSCNVCSKNFRDIGTLIDHGTELHQDCSSYLQCFPCKEIFSDADLLQTHAKIHNRRLSTTKRKSYNKNIQMQDPIVLNTETKEEDTRRRSYKCNECGKSFIKLCHLKQHQLAHTGDRPFKCDKCIKTFKSRNALTIHDRKHLNLKPYKCDTCAENFVSKTILKRHKLSHSDVRNFICPYCQKSFKSNSNCRNHIRTHQVLATPSIMDAGVSTNDKADVASQNKRTCQYCNRYFKKPIDLRRHERIHTGERPFKCDKCEKSFSLASTLKFHQRIHEEIKHSYTCHVCSNKYATKDSLKVHKRIHTGEKPFKCKYCDITFRTNGHRSLHESNHLKIAFERGIDPKDVKMIKPSKFESVVENYTFN